MADVALAGVTKRFGDVVAVDDLSLVVPDGAFVVLLGPTGAGKTTTLRLTAGLEEPDAGTITIGRRDVTRLAPAMRDVAMVFQQFSLYPHYSVYDNLAFPLRSPLRRHAGAEIETIVRSVARLLHIEDKLTNSATRLSGGEMQRVAIGRALVRRPAAFLMDEPLSSLDAKLREELRIELKRIQIDLGATILYVTHDHVEAMTLADRIGVLENGRLAQIGTPEAIYAAPDSLYVANRLGSPPMNALPPEVLGLPDGPAGAATVGVRPEDVVLGEGPALGTVRVVEHLGAETVIVVDIGGQEIRALLADGRSQSAHERVAVGVRDGAALFFGSDGRRIPWDRTQPLSERRVHSHAG